MADESMADESMADESMADESKADESMWLTNPCAHSLVPRPFPI